MTHLLRHIVTLEKTVGAFAPKGLFAPQDFFVSGEVNRASLDIETLQSFARRMACFINMPFFKITVVAAKEKNSVAGHIEGSDSQNVYIEIEPEFLTLDNCSYERQFKGASIGVLESPADWKKVDDERTGRYWQESGFGCLYSLFLQCG